MKSGKSTVCVGASRSGKTQYAMEVIKKCLCVLIWDPECQYEVTHRASNINELWLIVKACAGRKCTIGYTGKLSDFNTFCRVAFWFVRACCLKKKRSAVVFEETADVTSPSKAPEWYGVILRRGLKYGADLVSITQRPAESDKTSIGNASQVHVCRMNLPRDRRYMSECTGVPLDRIEKLRADQDNGVFDYISVDTGRGICRTGQLKFPRGKPKFYTASDQIPL